MPKYKGVFSSFFSFVQIMQVSVAIYIESYGEND